MSQKIIVTGASGAFGIVTCQALIEKGHQVVGTMRSTKGKNEKVGKLLQSKGVHLVEMDVTNEASVNEGIAKSIKLLGGLDVIFNNAGIGANGVQELFTAEDMQRVFDVNVFGVQRVMRAILPHFRQQGRGTILYTSSCIGRVTTPFLGIYSASKYALESIAEGYRAELSGFGIESCLIEPGGMPTAFMGGMLLPSDTERRQEYGEMADLPVPSLQGYVQFLESIPMQRPQKVADAVAELLAMPFGEKPFRTIVDFTGMKEAIEPYNQALQNVTHQLYTNMGIDGMLRLNKD
ncbi:MAG: NAD(P)-dependent dehydrogenase (short-subunit alcohol dehydrogenase family) [Cognaticolwellia sp.]|jgi:NAD(P)-dependent dehydrogenase (short-subunit alcohol dehydrogenase family)